MTRTLAARLSRALVGCYPRRWRQRYASELLDVLDQHRAGARTVLNLAGSAVSTHLDPAYRMEGLTMNRLRRTALISLAVVIPVALIAVPFGLFVAAQNGQDSHWHIGIEGGVDAMAFSPDQRNILVTATSGADDGLDTLWNVGSPARPRKLASFEGGAPTAFAPDGRTVVTVSFHDQPALWNVANLTRPARITTLRTGDSSLLWGEAFSPDGQVLATAYTDRLYLWNVTNPARPRLLRTLAAPVVPPAPAACGQPCQAPDPFYQGDIAFSPDGRLLASTVGHNQVALWNVTDPAHATRIATVPGASGFIDAVAFSPRGDLLADISYEGTVAMFSLTSPARPARVATMQTLPAVQLAADPCACSSAMYTLAFAPDGRTLTVVASTSMPPQPIASPNAQTATLPIRDYVFVWDVASPQSVTRITVFSRNIDTGYGNTSLPLLTPDGHTVAAGAPFGSFGMKLWTLP
ncbi:MAG: WD40 repeat domain-containing protein [Streptosporangiaceae bacterium]